MDKSKIIRRPGGYETHYPILGRVYNLCIKKQVEDAIDRAHALNSLSYAQLQEARKFHDLTMLMVRDLQEILKNGDWPEPTEFTESQPDYRKEASHE